MSTGFLGQVSVTWEEQYLHTSQGEKSRNSKENVRDMVVN